MNRRSFLIALAAPAIVRAESLMPVRARIPVEFGFLETFRIVRSAHVSADWRWLTSTPAHNGQATSLTMDDITRAVELARKHDQPALQERFLVVPDHLGNGRYSIDIPGDKLR